MANEHNGHTMKKTLPKNVEALMKVLPQTQCGDCSYQGCQPYADAIVHHNERIDRCLPGGVATLKKIAELTHRDPTPHIDQLARQEKPPTTAAIDENACIGCTKCIAACPVDAIIGAAKLMHTIIRNECTGCGLCIDPCPVDCIDLNVIEQPQYEPTQARHRFEARKQRLAQAYKKNKQAYQTAVHADMQDPEAAEQAKQVYIQQAIARVKAKRNVTPEV